jgi:hypothetical protein
MFSRRIVTNITSPRGTLHCRKTRIPCWDQLVICGQYVRTHTPDANKALNLSVNITHSLTAWSSGHRTRMGDLNRKEDSSWRELEYPLQGLEETVHWPAWTERRSHMRAHAHRLRRLISSADWTRQRCSCFQGRYDKGTRSEATRPALSTPSGCW